MGADNEIRVIIAGEDKLSGPATDAKDSIGKLGESTEQAGKQAEGMNIHSREMRLLLTEINKLAPGVGHELHAAFAGPLGAVILLTMAIVEAKQKLKEYNDELDKEGAAAAEGHVEAVQAVRDAWDEVKSSQAQYLAQLADAGKDKDPVATQLKRIREIEQAQLESDKKIIESFGKVEEARIRKEGGGEDQLQAARARTQSAVNAIEDNFAQRGISDLQKALAEAKQKAPGLAAAEAAATEEAGGAKAAFNVALGERDRLRKPDDELTKKIESAATAVEQAGQKLKDTQQMSAAGVSGFTPVQVARSEETLKEKQAELDTLNNESKNRAKYAARLEEEVPALQQRAAAAEEALRLARAAQTQNKNRIGELPDEIAQKQALETIKSSGAGVAGGPMNPEALVRAVMDTSKTADEHQAAVGNLQSALAFLGTSAQNINNIVDRLLDHSLNQVTESNSMKQRLANLESQAKTFGVKTFGGY